MNKARVEVLSYNFEWPDLYMSEKFNISSILGDEVISIYHIGSTSVPNLSAKPIIDIMVEVKSVDQLDIFNLEMEKSGYKIMGEYGIDGRRFYIKGDGQRSLFHVHAFNTGSENISRHLAFRDYLRDNPEVAKEYGGLKVDCASKCNNDIELYCSLKNGFIKKYEEIALVGLN